MCLACLQTLRRQIAGKVYFKPSNTISTFNWKPRRDSAQRSQVKLTQCNLKLNSFLIITRWLVCVQIWLGSISNLRNTFDLSIQTYASIIELLGLPFLWISISAEYIISQFVLFVDYLRITQWVSQRALNITKMDVVSLLIKSCDLFAHDRAAIVHFSPKNTML